MAIGNCCRIVHVMTNFISAELSISNLTHHDNYCHAGEVIVLTVYLASMVCQQLSRARVYVGGIW